MNYQDYAKKISDKYNLYYEESERLLKFLFENISKDLAKGHRVYFRGFGGFKKIKRPAHKYRNMITNKIETRPPKKDIAFKTSKKLLDRL